MRWRAVTARRPNRPSRAKREVFPILGAGDVGLLTSPWSKFESVRICGEIGWRWYDFRLLISKMVVFLCLGPRLTLLKRPSGAAKQSASGRRLAATSGFRNAKQTRWSLVRKKRWGRPWVFTSFFYFYLVISMKWLACNSRCRRDGVYRIGSLSMRLKNWRLCWTAGGSPILLFFIFLRSLWGGGPWIRHFWGLLPSFPEGLWVLFEAKKNPGTWKAFFLNSLQQFGALNSSCFYELRSFLGYKCLRFTSRSSSAPHFFSDGVFYFLYSGLLTSPHWESHENGSSYLICKQKGHKWLQAPLNPKNSKNSSVPRAKLSRLWTTPKTEVAEPGGCASARAQAWQGARRSEKNRIRWGGGSGAAVILVLQWLAKSFGFQLGFKCFKLGWRKIWTGGVGLPTLVDWKAGGL